MSTPIAKMVREMIERGVDIDIIELAVATAEQVNLPRNSTESAEERRKRKDRERKRNSTEIPRNSTEFHGNAESASISKNKKESKRGTRIDATWNPSDPERAFAKQEGFADFEIDREAQKFRDYWTACAGARGVKLDWSATWRQWIRSGADRAGKKPAAQAAGTVAAGYYAQAESPQLDAWDMHTRKTTGKGLPRDRNGGWRVASEWPPDYSPPDDPPGSAPPLFRTMQ